MALPSPLPDSPTKWDGWKNYNSPNPYERLCLSFEGNPSDFQIEENCRQLLVWWQKKLPLKNQPSNPLTQLLRNGLDEAPRFLAEARTELLDTAGRARVDEVLRAQMKERATSEFVKFFSFAVTNGVLAKADEVNLLRLGQESGLTLDELNVIIEEELKKTGAKRYVEPEPQPTPSPTAANAGSGAASSGSSGAHSSPADEFRRMLKLSGLAGGDFEMTDDQRDALCNMGENLGLTGGQAEDLIDEYLEAAEEILSKPMAASSGAATATARAAAVASARTAGASKPPAPPKAAPSNPANRTPAPKEEPTPKPQPAEKKIDDSPLARAQEKARFPNFRNGIGIEMLLVQSGNFLMGSAAPDAGPNEQPVSKVSLSCFYMSRFTVTNALYEMFDPRHASKRAAGAGDNHPVVYVSSLEAIEFCRWLSLHERRKYRLPTEAEWEYASRGPTGRTYPWGEKLDIGHYANFADVNTSFAWREPDIDDGYAETAPVGSFPRGASPFGIEDMAGNVWEWCNDFFEIYKGKDRANPRGPMNGGARVYRGGSWKSRATSLRCATRNVNLPAYSSNDVGFRVVCECE